MTATLYLRKKVIDDLTGVAAYAPPAALWLSLHTADPGDAGSFVNEVSGGGYARVSLAGKMSAADSATGISVNTVAITLGPATTNWGTVNFIGLNDAATAGNMLVDASPTLPKTITVGVPFQIPPGNLRLRLA
jgi:hypothetical protein